MADTLITDLEIVVLCDLLEGPRANLKVHKRSVLDQLLAKGLVEPAPPRRVACKISTYRQGSTLSRGTGRRTKRRLGRPLLLRTKVVRVTRSLFLLAFPSSSPPPFTGCDAFRGVLVVCASQRANTP